MYLNQPDICFCSFLRLLFSPAVNFCVVLLVKALCSKNFGPVAVLAILVVLSHIRHLDEYAKLFVKI
jgi:hypothetical protein